MNTAAMGMVAGTVLSLAVGAHAHAYGRPGDEPRGGRVTVHMSETRGDDRYEVSIRDGVTTAKINGREVPADRVRQNDGKVEVLDETGKTVATFNLGQVLQTPQAPRQTTRGRARWTPDGGAPAVAPEPPQPPAAAMATTNQPPVMMGVTMSEPSEALLEHLGLKEDEAVLIERVVPGLPAERAGLRAKDIIVEFDGVRPIDESKIREMLRAKKPGDRVAIKVLRRGAEETLALELDKFDMERLGVGATGVQGMPLGPGNVWNMDPGAMGLDRDEVRRQVEEAMRNLEGQGGAEGGRNRFWFMDPEGQLRGFTPMDNARAERLRAELEERMAELDRKMSRLDEQMARLQAVLERLEAQKKP